VDAALKERTSSELVLCTGESSKGLRNKGTFEVSWVEESFPGVKLPTESMSHEPTLSADRSLRVILPD
jgi:hypothetical protein